LVDSDGNRRQVANKAKVRALGGFGLVYAV